jgi:hypothetical protein
MGLTVLVNAVREDAEKMSLAIGLAELRFTVRCDVRRDFAGGADTVEKGESGKGEPVDLLGFEIVISGQYDAGLARFAGTQVGWVLGAEIV